VLSNILGHHPLIEAGSSSPLCSVVQSMRNSWSNDVFFKSQLDYNFESMIKKVKRSTISVMQAWVSDSNKNVVIDKNRGWLFCLEWLKEIDPDFKMIVTLRDLRDIYASIERQHRKTILINFPDNMEHNVVDLRAKSLFDDGGLIGSCLKAINNIYDVPDIINHLFIWRYEDFLLNPEETTDKIFKFMNLDSIDIDFENIKQLARETDGINNMKYLHTIKPSLTKPENIKDAKVSPRIIQTILQKYSWYYENYYPNVISNQEQNNFEKVMPEETKLIEDLEKAIQIELKQI